MEVAKWITRNGVRGSEINRWCLQRKTTWNGWGKESNGALLLIINIKIIKFLKITLRAKRIALVINWY